MESIEQQLIRHEGLRLKPYRCPAGKLTIGVGRNIEDRGISEEEAMFLLRNDIETCKRELNERYPFILSLDPERYNVLVNMCFNMGIERLSQFRRMLAHISLGNYIEAAKEGLDSQWAKQVGPRAIELMKIMEGS